MQKLEHYQKHYEIKLSGDVFHKHVLNNLKENEKLGYKWKHEDEGRYYKLTGGLCSTLKFNMSYDLIDRTLTIDLDAIVTNNLEAKEVGEINDFIRQLKKISELENISGVI